MAIKAQKWLRRESLSFKAALEGKKGSVLSLVRLLLGDKYLREHGKNIVSEPLLGTYSAEPAKVEVWKIYLR